MAAPEKKTNDTMKNLSAAGAKIAAMPVQIHLSIGGAAAIFGTYEALTSTSRFMAYLMWFLVAPIFVGLGFRAVSREMKELKILTSPPIYDLEAQGSRYAKSVVLAYFGLQGFRPADRPKEHTAAPYDYLLSKFGDKTKTAVLLRIRDWDDSPVSLDNLKALHKERGEMENGIVVVVTNQDIPSDAASFAEKMGIEVNTPRRMIELIQKMTGEKQATEMAQEG